MQLHDVAADVAALTRLLPHTAEFSVALLDKLARADLSKIDQRIEKLSSRFLTAAAPAVAASELQNLVKGMASAAKTETRSERILPTVERGELVEIPVEIAVSGEVRELVDLLNRIDASPKLIRVTDLKIRVMNITQPKDLLATMTLSGFIRPGKTKT